MAALDKWSREEIDSVIDGGALACGGDDDEKPVDDDHYLDEQEICRSRRY